MAAARFLNRVAWISAGAGVVGGILQASLYTGASREMAKRVRPPVSPFSFLPASKSFRYSSSIPHLLQYPTVFDVRLRPRVISTRTGTRDLQQVSISLRVLSRPNVEHLPEIFRELGEDYSERVLPSICNEVLKATVAQFDADQLLTQREKVSQQIREELNDRATEFHLVLDDVSITHLTFGREFTRAIEHKQVAQQEAERSKFIVMRAEQEKKAAIIKAEGDSQAAELISKALQESGDAIIDVKRIDAAKDIADTLARSRHVTYLPGSGSNLLLSLQHHS